MHHELKILPAYFQAAESGEKNFEVRNNDDRGFQRGDIVTLQEFEASNGAGGRYTGRELLTEITYVTNYGQPPGQVVFGFTVMRDGA